MFTFKLWRTALATTIQFVCATSLAQANPHHIELGIVAQPRPVFAEEGKNVTLAIVLKGPVKSVQWRKNGVPIEFANDTRLDVVASQNKSAPDTYDVLIQDAFGNTVISAPATVTITQADAPVLIDQNRNSESLKLQGLFNLIHVFDQVAARVSEPLEYSKANRTLVAHYPVCPETSIIETIEPTPQAPGSHAVVRLKLNSCFVPKTNRLGEESGALISGKYSRSSKSFQRANKEVQVVEQLAQMLTLRFPYAQDRRNFNAMDFDITLNGGLTLQTEVNAPSANAATFRRESIWKRGTTVKNPQTGVNAEFISGKYVQETFGVYRKDEFLPYRETDFFDKLTLKVGEDTVVINGGVTRIYDKSDVHRHGQFNISVNGKHVLDTQSMVTAPTTLSFTLPNAPKLNGFFLNDHPKDKPKEPIKMVSPGRNSSVKIN